MIGTVQKIGSTRNGAPFYTVDGKDYFLSRDIGEPPTQGAKIEFEYEEFGEAKGKWGRPRRISKWQPVRNAAGKPETGSTISDADILRSVSNVVGNACAAGTVKDPEDLEKWFVAAWAGFTRRTKAMNAKPDPEFDDDLPDSAYEGLPETNGNMQRAGGKW
jgi:hypothetical protein